MFANIDPYEMTSIMDAVKPAEFKSGQQIFQQAFSHV